MLEDTDVIEDDAAHAAEDDWTAEAESAEDGGTEIRDTDIVFDCPHCGHNLAIDYRGAGLQISCVNCGENVLVPIPDGMKIDDLDIEPGEILKQLFKTRRDLQKQEARVAELEEQVRQMVERNSTLYARCETFAMQVGELRDFCRQTAAVNGKMAELLDRAADELAAPQDDAGADGAEAAAEEA